MLKYALKRKGKIYVQFRLPCLIDKKFEGLHAIPITINMKYILWMDGVFHYKKISHTLWIYFSLDKTCLFIIKHVLYFQKQTNRNTNSRDLDRTLLIWCVIRVPKFDSVGNNVIVLITSFFHRVNIAKWLEAKSRGEVFLRERKSCLRRCLCLMGNKVRLVF